MFEHSPFPYPIAIAHGQCCGAHHCSLLYSTCSIPLPYSETVYGWSAVTNALSIPGTKVDEFVQWCLSRCAALSAYSPVAVTDPMH